MTVYSRARPINPETNFKVKSPTVFVRKVEDPGSTFEFVCDMVISDSENSAKEDNGLFMS